MDMAREISKLKNHHWLKIDHVTCKTLDLIQSEYTHAYSPMMQHVLF